MVPSSNFQDCLNQTKDRAESSNNKPAKVSQYANNSQRIDK